MKIHKVAVTLTQDNIEQAAKDWLPDGYALEHVHLHSTGMLASLKTPFVRLDVLLRKEAELAQGVFVFSLEVSKGVKVPRLLIQKVLQKLAGSLPKGIAVIEHQIVLSVNELWAPFVKAESVTLQLKDGEWMLIAEPLSIPAQPNGKDIKAQGEIAL